MKNFLKLIFLLSVVFSCSENEPAATIFPVIGENSVNLSNPIQGQQSVYVRYSTNCSDIEKNVTFTGDTIQLTVAYENNKIMFKETFTPNSPMFISSQLPQEMSYEYNLKDGYSLIKDRINSQLFFFYGNDTLFLSRTDKVRLEQVACQFILEPGQIFIGDEIGYFDDFKVGQITVSDKDAVSCIPIFLSMEAYLIYDNNHLSMSHTMQEGEIAGWLQIQ